jgi:hypothetical protein
VGLVVGLLKEIGNNWFVYQVDGLLLGYDQEFVAFSVKTRTTSKLFQ